MVKENELNMQTVTTYNEFLSEVGESTVLPNTTVEFDEQNVTPQMYGAVGDGVTDDSQAIQAAINSGKSVVFPMGRYLITTTLTLKGVKFFDCEKATILYNGSGYAFNITDNDCSLYKFGVIRSENGGCIKFSNDTGYTQYVDVYFRELHALDKCIFVDVPTTWITELRFYNGRFGGGNYGFYADNGQEVNRINGLKFSNIGVEGVTTGFYFANSIQCTSIISPRYAEAFTTLIKTVGSVGYLYFFGSNVIRPSYLDLSERTSGKFVSQFVTEDWGLVAHSATIFKGVVHPDISFYTNASSDELDLTNNPRVYNYINSRDCQRIKLSKRYGNEVGLNEFVIFVYRENNNPLKVYDDTDTLIWEMSGYSAGHVKRYLFRYYMEIGWIVREL